ncbi:MAG: hypothetical protein KDL87_15995 [Verrucomicrobiae bacterium]|nr:hypothetical protein [Verrucomicrobiae bacterium]
MKFAGNGLRLAAQILVILYGLFWLWSGVAKLKDPAGFAMAIRNFRLLGDPWIAASALFIPAVEIVCASSVVFGKGRWGALSLLWVSLLIFTTAIVISWVRGLDISCGCFGTGDGSTVHYPAKVAQNLALLALGGWLWWWERTQHRRSVSSLP